MQSFIEIAISVLLLFLLVSVVVTAINEIVSRMLHLRGSLLFKGIVAIIDNEDLRRNFYSSGVIFSASLIKDQNTSGIPKPKEHPSYIHAENFAKALIQAVTRPADGNPVAAEYSKVQEAIANLPKGRIKDVLVASLNEGVQDIKSLEASLAKWYDSATERLSGEYKRFKQTISFCLGLGLAVMFNIDTLDFVSRVEADAELRKEIVAQAVTLAGDPEKITGCQEESGQSGNTEASVQAVTCYANAMSGALEDLNSLPVGWDAKSWSAFKSASPGQWLMDVLGWLITAFAVTLGAPFWFDLLKTFVNLRPSGKPPAQPVSDSAGSNGN